MWNEKYRFKAIEEHGDPPGYRSPRRRLLRDGCSRGLGDGPTTS